MSEARDSFSGKIGFILTAAGAAIGLSCLWRFPYLAAENGGGLFILTYIVLLAALGIPLLITKIAIGRKTQLGVLGAFKKLNPKFSFIGGLCLLVIGLVQPYYSVLGGEVTNYTFMYLIGQGAAVAEPGYYDTFISLTAEPLFWFAVFVILTGIVCLFGLKNGVERICKYLMPIEAVILVLLAIYCLTLPGAFEGLYYYLAPDFSTFSPNTILVAMGQVFYSLSLGFGIMLTFGSYLSKKINLVNAACSTGFFTFLISFIAGSVIIPASFLYTNGNPAVLGSGSIFSSLPMVFQTIPLGWIIGAIFFILLFFAALTSNIAALEVVVAAFKDRFGIKRPVTVLIGTVYTLAIGSIICLGYGPLSWIHIGDLHLLEIFDKISGDFLLPVIALLVCIMVGFFLKRDVILDELKLFTRFRHDKLYLFMIKYFCPICIIIIFISNIIGAFL